MHIQPPAREFHGPPACLKFHGKTVEAVGIALSWDGSAASARCLPARERAPKGAKKSCRAFSKQFPAANDMQSLLHIN